MPKPTMEPDHPAEPTSDRVRLLRLLCRDFAWRLGVILTVLALEFAVEPLWGAQWLRVSAHNLFQHYLQPRLDARAPVVVDISDIPLTADESTVPGRSITSRTQLLRLLHAIADQKPRAVAIDIDFSPDERGFIGKKDEEFFRACLRLKKQGMPVVLGINRTRFKPVEKWLGKREYAELAGNIRLPTPDFGTSRMPLWVQAPQMKEHGPAFGARLAGKEKEEDVAAASALSWALETFKEETADDFRFLTFLVDYSPIEMIYDEALAPKDLRAHAEAFGPCHDRLVLIGYLKNQQDPNVYVPGRGPWPGVAVHACAAHTLATAPLRELSFWGRVAADLLLACLVLASLMAIRGYFILKRGFDIGIEPLENFLRGLVLIAAFLLFVIFVTQTRIIWDDFLLVIVLSVLHPRIERLLLRLTAWLAALWRMLAKTLFPPAGREE